MSKKDPSANRWHLDSRAPKNHLRTRILRASFLCQADTARMRKPAADSPCPWDLFGLCSICQFGAKGMKDETTGNNSPTPVWRMEGGQANSPAELLGGNGGSFFPRSESCETVPQQGSLLDQDSLHLVEMCSLSASGFGITWDASSRHNFSCIIFSYVTCLGTLTTAGENFSIRYRQHYSWKYAFKVLKRVYKWRVIFCRWRHRGWGFPQICPVICW